jgi:hypothetical protein
MKLTNSVYCLLSAAIFSWQTQACKTDDDCNLNGICRQGRCQCDPGWIAGDCGMLDLRPAIKGTGYNLTGEGTSSWGAKIIHDPKDNKVFHVFMAEFTHGCGLDYWSPYSRIIRSKSTSGPAGPYVFEAEIVGTFAHNPTVVYSEAEKLYLMYSIGCPQTVPDTCQTVDITCDPGNFLNGESGISMWSSPDLYSWKFHGQVLQGDVNGTWDADTTNPSPFPLWSASDRTHEMLLAYRGCPFNCNGGAEQISVASAPTFTGPYTRAHKLPVFQESNEDPFVWRDKRGNFHMLLHSLEADGGFGSGPKVGRHAYARKWDGEWTFNNNTLTFSTLVNYTDGTSIDYYRRERPQLFFSEDGEMTPLFMTNGVQEMDSPASYTLVQPIGDGAEKYVESLDFGK